MRERRGCLLRMVLVSVMGLVGVWLVGASPASGASLARVGPYASRRGRGALIPYLVPTPRAVSIRREM